MLIYFDRNVWCIIYLTLALIRILAVYCCVALYILRSLIMRKELQTAWRHWSISSHVAFGRFAYASPTIVTLANIERLAYRNKSVRSNLGRGPRRGTVAHVSHRVAIGYNGVPQIHPKSTPSRGPIPKPHYLPHSWTRPTYDAKRHPDPIRRFAAIHWTDRRTYGPTDRPRESLMTIGRYAMRATRPKNKRATQTGRSVENWSILRYTVYKYKLLYEYS